MVGLFRSMTYPELKRTMDRDGRGGYARPKRSRAEPSEVGSVGRQDKHVGILEHEEEDRGRTDGRRGRTTATRSGSCEKVSRAKRATEGKIASERASERG